LGHKRSGRGFRYLTRFKGYSSAEDKWLTSADLKNAQQILNEYKHLHEL